MANRPIFIPVGKTKCIVREVHIDFPWTPGYSVLQKRKNIHNLHKAANAKGMHNLLEVSSRSRERIGRQLSAFNMGIVHGDNTKLVEGLYQGSKVFEDGGPYTDMHTMTGREAKQDQRLRTSGRLVGFEYNGIKWPLEPKTAFYDWLYIDVLIREHSADAVANYDGFTDIEFNSRGSINCQARAVARAVALHRLGTLGEVMHSQQTFLDAYI